MLERSFAIKWPTNTPNANPARAGQIPPKIKPITAPDKPQKN